MASKLNKAGGMTQSPPKLNKAGGMPEAPTRLNKAGGIVGRWTKGQSGNPRGRPSQAPFKAAMEALRAAQKKG